MSLAVLISTASTLVGALISAAWAVYFGMMFYGDYWSNRDCFNAGGYCDYVDAGGETIGYLAEQDFLRCRGRHLPRVCDSPTPAGAADVAPIRHEGRRVRNRDGSWA